MVDALRPGGPVISAFEALAARGTSEDLNKTLAQLLHEEPEDNATQVEETLEPDAAKAADTANKPLPSPTTINLFQHPDAHPFVLDVALLHRYGIDWMGWEPEVLEAKILHDFRTRSISDLNFDKIQAVKTLHLVDTFWQQWTVFVPCALALSGVHAEFRVLTAPTVPQAMIAIDIAAKIRKDTMYSFEIEKFLEVVYLHDGIVCPTDSMANIVHVDASLYGIDVDAVRQRWDDVRRSGKAPEGRTLEDDQLRRMLEAHRLLEDNRKQLQEQLPLAYQ